MKKLLPTLLLCLILTTSVFGQVVRPSGRFYFWQLWDTPDTYVSQAGKGVRVNSESPPDGLEFYTLSLGDFDSQTAWRIFYSNTAGDVTELALGANGTFLESNGVSSAPAFRALLAGDIPDISATYQPLDATLTDIADGTIAENLVNTTNPWADNEVADNITIDLATLATTITITDNESTAENNPIVFVAGADPDGGSLGLETDGDFHYNPSTGTATATEFVGGGAGLTALDGENISNDTIDNDSIDWVDMTDLTTDGEVVWGNIAEGELANSTIVSADVKDGEITEVDLNVTNTPGAGEDDYVLTYNHAGTNMTWAAAGAGDITSVWDDAAGAVTQPVIGTGEFLDGGTATVDAAGEGILLPRGADVSAATAEGQISWDSDNDLLYVGDGAAVVSIAGSFDSTAVDATTWSDNANASNIWTFDVSGTDHTMTAGNGEMAFSHDLTLSNLTSTVQTGTLIRQNIDYTLQPAGGLSGTTNLISVDVVGIWDSDQDGETQDGYIYGGFFRAITLDAGATGNIHTLRGLQGQSTHFGTGTAGEQIGIYSYVLNDDTNSEDGDITNAYNFYANAYTDKGTGTVGTRYGFYALNMGGGGNLTNQYGVYVADMTGATNDYGIAIAGADTYALWVSSAAQTTDAANGITFGSGGDTNLYRSAANMLKSDDGMTASTFTGDGSALTAIDAATGDSATAFFDAGTLEHEYGGLEADISSYTGLVAITGGSTAEVDSKSELEGHIADVADFAEADGDTWTGTHDLSGATVTMPKRTKNDDRFYTFNLFNPNSLYDKDTQVCFEPNLPANITITEVTITCDADPATELDIDLKWADAFIGLGNAALIEPIDTTNGTTDIDSGFDDATVAAGKCLYVEFAADPDSNITQAIVKIRYDYD